jgi:hypothetical protein
MLLAPIPWAGRVWALPFLTVLAPSERHCRRRGRRHKRLTDWARQMALQARRWLPGREVVLLGDGTVMAWTGRVPGGVRKGWDDQGRGDHAHDQQHPA